MDTIRQDPQRSTPRVILVDDDEFFVESLTLNLRDSGFEVATFGDGPSLLKFLADGKTGDIVLLDWKLPGVTGIEVLRKLREMNRNIPVIFLTVLSQQVYEEAALFGGAVDFVEKSRSFSILRKRIELILSGLKTTTESGPRANLETTVAQQAPPAPLRLGNLKLARDISRAFWKGTQVALTLTEFRIVETLASRAGKDVRYRELYDLVHHPGFVAGEGDEGYRANVRTLMRRIRQKFRDIDGNFEHVETYPGFGYRWRADDSRET